MCNNNMLVRNCSQQSGPAIKFQQKSDVHTVRTHSTLTISQQKHWTRSSYWRKHKYKHGHKGACLSLQLSPGVLLISELKLFSLQFAALALDSKEKATLRACLPAGYANYTVVQDKTFSTIFRICDLRASNAWGKYWPSICCRVEIAYSIFQSPNLKGPARRANGQELPWVKWIHHWLQSQHGKTVKSINCQLSKSGLERSGVFSQHAHYTKWWEWSSWEPHEA